MAQLIDREEAILIVEDAIKFEEGFFIRNMEISNLLKERGDSKRCQKYYDTAMEHSSTLTVLRRVLSNIASLEVK